MPFPQPQFPCFLHLAEAMLLHIFMQSSHVINALLPLIGQHDLA